MTWHRLLLSALQSIGRNRMRSILTMLGIIIGVGAVIIMVAVGQGAQEDIEARISSLGTNLIIVNSTAGRTRGVSSGAGSGQSLTLEDVERLRTHARSIAGVTPVISARVQAVGGDGNWNTRAFGVSPDYQTIRNWEMAEGAFFSEEDVVSRNRVAVLGRTVADELFPDRNPVGERIRLDKGSFTIVGLLAPKGESAFGSDQDDLILAPATTVFYRMASGRRINQIQLSAVDEAGMPMALEEITRVLRQSHGLRGNQPDDFRIRTQTELADTASETTRTLTLLLASIAGISLLVGGIGIMNIMLVSVTERTREIGIRMAVGARGRDVLSQFLIEAIVLSLLGGLTGVAVSLLVTSGLERFFDISTAVHPGIVLISLGFSAAVGVFFGFYPARKAASLNPIDALRFE